MRLLYNFFLLIQILLSCNNKSFVDTITVKAVVENIPAKKIYLANANQWDKFIDSADYVKGGFSFQIKAKNSFTPMLVSISIIDTVDGKTKTLYFRNSVLSPAPDSAKYLTNFFVLERGITEIKGVYNSYNQLDISAGIETLAMFRTQMMNFGYINGTNNAKNGETIRLYKEIIADYPSSYYLFEKILENKELYSSGELNEYISLFTPELQKSNLADTLSKYILSRSDPKSSMPWLILATEDGNKKIVNDQNAKLNMLVFWASWCAPCRAEIPELKKIHADFKTKGLTIFSISIDQELKKWRQAIIQEKMPWHQFIVDSADIERVKKEYDFSVIPFTIIIDKNGTPVTRLFGFESQKLYEEKKYFLDSLLKNY